MGEVLAGELPVLDQYEPVAGVVTQDGLDAVGALGGRLHELDGLQVTVVHGDEDTVWVPSSALFSAADGTPQLRVQAEGAAFEVFDVETGAPAGGWVPVVDPPPTLTAATRLLAGDA